MKIIDLSFPYQQGFAVVPNHPSVTLTPIDTHEKDGKSNTLFSISIHSGTHIDCPYHFFPDGISIDEVPLERFIRPGINLGLVHLGSPNTPISSDDLEKAAERYEDQLDGAIVLLHTGWSQKMYHLPNYYGDNPYLTLDSCEWLVKHKVNLVGLDMPPGPKAGRGFKGKGCSSDIHRALLGGNVLIGENLINLDQLPASGFRVSALPIKIYKGDGAPARIIALFNEE